jgi:CPA1 family monovalent cation:H+ antiporter
MTPFQILAALITLAAVFSYLNHRYLRLPQTIGVMVLGLATSLILLAVGEHFPAVSDFAQKLLNSIPLSETVLQGMLGYLLFAGALHLNLADVWAHRRVIFTLATVGVALSTVIVGGLMWLALRELNVPIPWSHCLLFGALISPTDPIAVLAIMKSLKAPKALEVQISGESLFNDGIGVVIFLAVLGFAGLGGGHHAGPPRVAAVLFLFLREAVGGAAFGLFCGLIAYQMLKRIDQYQVEILISLALVTGGYALAQTLDVSGPIAMVVAGLFIGNRGRQFAMSEQTRVHLDLFWGLIDDILNSILFLLIGLEVLVLSWERVYIIAGLIAIVVTLAARLISITLPIMLLGPLVRVPRRAIIALTWGGLRGGISVALALSLQDPSRAHRDLSVDLLIVMTYVVVVFSIGAQGLTIGPLLRRMMKNVSLEKP